MPPTSSAASPARSRCRRAKWNSFVPTGRRPRRIKSSNPAWLVVVTWLLVAFPPSRRSSQRKTHLGVASSAILRHGITHDRSHLASLSKRLCPQPFVEVGRETNWEANLTVFVIRPHGRHHGTGLALMHHGAMMPDLGMTAAGGGVIQPVKDARLLSGEGGPGSSRDGG